MLCPDPQPEACRHTGICPLHRQQGSGPCRMVWPYPGHRIEETMSPLVGWLTRAEMEAMLAVPDRKARRGRSEYALLLFLYNTGARVSEATQLKVRDLQIGRGNGGHDLATLHGKGGKTRQCPLWPETERVLADEILGRSLDDAVFVSRPRNALYPLRSLSPYRAIRSPGAGTG